MRISLIFIFTIFSLAAYSQEFSRGYIEFDEMKKCCTHIPSSGLNVYNSPDGKVIGEFVPNPELKCEDQSWGIYFNNYSTIEALDRELLCEIGYEIFTLEYTDHKNGFIRIQEGQWLNVKEVQSKGMHLTNWMSFLVARGGGFFAGDIGLNLRTGPSASNEKIFTMKGDLIEIKPTSETKGMWGKVKVIQYKKEPCEEGSGEDNIAKTYTGWTKLISDEHTPNVYWYSRGC